MAALLAATGGEALLNASSNHAGAAACTPPAPITAPAGQSAHIPDSKAQLLTIAATSSDDIINEMEAEPPHPMPAA